MGILEKLFFWKKKGNVVRLTRNFDKLNEGSRQRLLEMEKQEYQYLPKIKVDPERVKAVWLRDKAGMPISPQEPFSEKYLVQLLQDVVKGELSYLAMEFRFQGERVYVKRLKKEIFRPFTSALVVHHDTDALSCHFFAGDTKHCHTLVGDFHAYMVRDSSELHEVRIGNAVMPEWGEYKSSKGVDRALRWLFVDLDTADKRLSDSKLWSTENFSGGEKKYQKLCRSWGELENPPEFEQ